MNDRFGRGGPERHDPVDAGLALRLMDKSKKLMATCQVDDEPLVATMEFPKAEFYCVVCERRYGFLGPKAAEVTPELEARLDELDRLYDEERRARQEQG